MLRGLPLILILLATASAARGEEPRHRFGRVDPDEKPATAETARAKREEALACSTRQAIVQARTTQRDPAAIADGAWTACRDLWLTAMLQFGSAGHAVNGGGTGHDLSINALGKAGDLLKDDWYRQAPAIIAQARRTGPPL